MKRLFSILLFSLPLLSSATQLLIPMDEAQKNHLKAYGITYWVLTKGIEAEWLLNYRGGTFLFPYSDMFEKECNIRGVSYEKISEGKAEGIRQEIAQPDANMEVVKLYKAPKVAVYSPKSKQPWDDAVTLAMTYAEIPYETVFDDEVLEGKLPLYDWLHLHHEDFTGQYGKFWASFHEAAWYKAEVRENEAMAAKHGYKKVSQLKLAVGKKVKDFVMGGGYLFAMCSATDSYDIALAAEGVDICENVFDGDASDHNADAKLNFDNCYAFENFKLTKSPEIYEYSTIDMQPQDRNISEQSDVFTLFDFSAKSDMVNTLLCQNHTRVVKSFYGQTTAFHKNQVKSSVTILGENKQLGEARYIHGDLGKGTWTFYGGHDPEDYRHEVYEPPTDMNLVPNSPGYRLILNNVLFPSAKKKKLKT
ncbi:MAG: asparagine synthetase B [Flavobacteriaceae bacterium]|nr:asparagine synthetase B [Flavobacteriaceae bacterium]